MGEVYLLDAFRNNREKKRLVVNEEGVEPLLSNESRLLGLYRIRPIDQVQAEHVFALYRGEEMIALSVEKDLMEELKKSILQIEEASFPGSFCSELSGPNCIFGRCL